MDNTFTKDTTIDLGNEPTGLESSPQPTKDVVDPSSPIQQFPDNIITSTPTMASRILEKAKGNEMLRNNDPEHIAGCNKMDIIIMKHTSKQLMDIVKRLLESDEFEVRKCSDGSIVSAGRVSNFGTGGGNTVADEEFQRAIKERDQARQEASKMHENYVSLFDAFNAVKEATNDIRSAYEDAAEKLKTAAAEVDEWKAKFHAVRENANEELERASVEYDDLVKNHEEGTKGLRLRVKRMDVELSSKNDEINILKSRVAELSGICDQLINDADYDNESIRSSAYDA